MIINVSISIIPRSQSYYRVRAWALTSKSIKEKTISDVYQDLEVIPILHYYITHLV
jgi:hypothetical protein